MLLWWWCLVIAFIGFLRLVWRAAQCRHDEISMQMMELKIVTLQVLLAEVPYDPHEDEQILQEINKDGQN